jgi:hypothetical protein
MIYQPAGECLIRIKFTREAAAYLAPAWDRKVRVNHQQGEHMANASETHPMDEVPDEPVPVMQQLLDNPFLLLFLGIAMPTVLYIVWGVMEIVSLPVGK